MAGEDPYISEDERYGAMLGKVLNPPDEPITTADGAPSILNARPAPQAQPAAPSPAPAPAGQPWGDYFRSVINNDQRMKPQGSPSPAVPPAPATPNAVTPSGSGAATPNNTPSFYQRAQQGSLDALDQSSRASSTLQNQPDPTTENAPLQARRVALTAPIPYRDPATGKVLTTATDPLTGQTIDPAQMYKPGLGTKIARAIFPKREKYAGINDPNADYQAATAARQSQVAPLDQRMQQNAANYKTESDRLKDIGTETRAVSTGYGNVARDATSQENADTNESTRKDNSPAGVTAITQAQYDQRGKIADSLNLKGQNRTLYLVNGKLPDPRQATEAEIARSQATAAWQRQNPGRTPTLDDIATINAAAGGYGAAKGTSLTPNQQATITGQKNRALQKAQATLDAKGANATDDDKQAARDAFQDAQDNYEEILGVSKDSPDHMVVGPDLQWTRAGGQQAPAATPQAQSAAAPAQGAPRSAIETQQGQIYNGYKYLGGDKTKQTSWQKVVPK